MATMTYRRIPPSDSNVQFSRPDVTTWFLNLSNSRDALHAMVWMVGWIDGLLV